MPESYFSRQFKCGLICLFLFPFFSVEGQDDILHNYLDTVSNGDFAKWSEIKSLKATRVSFYGVSAFEKGIEDFSSDQISYSILYKLWPNKQKEELYRDSLFTNLTSEFYFIENTRTILLGNQPPMQVPADKSHSFDFYPVKVKSYIKESKAIRNHGLKLLPGKQIECYDIEIETRKDKHRLLINAKTFLLEAIFFPDVNIYWYISEYQNFQGYLIPTYILGVKDGVVFEWTKYKSFEFNPQISQSKFLVP